MLQKPHTIFETMKKSKSKTEREILEEKKSKKNKKVPLVKNLSYMENNTNPIWNKNIKELIPDFKLNLKYDYDNSFDEKAKDIISMYEKIESNKFVANLAKIDEQLKSLSFDFNNFECKSDNNVLNKINYLFSSINKSGNNFNMPLFDSVSTICPMSGELEIELINNFKQAVENEKQKELEKIADKVVDIIAPKILNNIFEAMKYEKIYQISTDNHKMSDEKFNKIGEYIANHLKNTLENRDRVKGY